MAYKVRQRRWQQVRWSLSGAAHFRMQSRAAILWRETSRSEGRKKSYRACTLSFFDIKISHELRVKRSELLMCWDIFFLRFIHEFYFHFFFSTLAVDVVEWCGWKLSDFTTRRLELTEWIIIEMTREKLRLFTHFISVVLSHNCVNHDEILRSSIVTLCRTKYHDKDDKK